MLYLLYSDFYLNGFKKPMVCLSPPKVRGPRTQGMTAANPRVRKPENCSDIQG